MKVVRIMIIFWIINEVLQYYRPFDSHLIFYFIIHLSSFYGSFLLSYFLINHDYKILIFSPLIIQLLYNLILKDSYDFPDLCFSFFGIITAIILNKKFKFPRLF